MHELQCAVPSFTSNVLLQLLLDHESLRAIEQSCSNQKRQCTQRKVRQLLQLSPWARAAPLIAAPSLTIISRQLLQQFTGGSCEFSAHKPNFMRKCQCINVGMWRCNRYSNGRGKGVRMVRTKKGRSAVLLLLVRCDEDYCNIVCQQV